MPRPDAAVIEIGHRSGRTLSASCGASEANSADALERRIVVLRGKSVGRTWHENAWWFSVQDVVAVLTDSADPADSIKKTLLRDEELAQGWGQLVTPLLLETGSGTQRVNCASTEGIFRIIQSIPSPKAEPFKRRLAQVGYDRENHTAAREGRTVAGNARLELEAKSGQPVLSSGNYLRPSLTPTKGEVPTLPCARGINHEQHLTNPPHRRVTTTPFSRAC